MMQPLGSSSLHVNSPEVIKAGAAEVRTIYKHRKKLFACLHSVIETHRLAFWKIRQIGSNSNPNYLE